MRFFVVLEPKNLKKRAGLDFFEKICYNMSVHYTMQDDTICCFVQTTLFQTFFDNKEGKIWIGIFHLLTTALYGAFWYSLVF